MFNLLLGVGVALLFVSLPASEAWSLDAKCALQGVNAPIGRRAYLRTLSSSAVAIAALTTTAPRVRAAQAPVGGTDAGIERLRRGKVGLEFLLNNWKEQTTQCNFADVSRDILEAKNKEKLLKAATTNVLFDKSGANLVMSCKRTAKVVREITATGSPFDKADVIMRRAVTKVDPDVVEEYLEKVDRWEQLLASVKGSSYMSGTGDFASMNNFRESEGQEKDGSLLEQARTDLTEMDSVLASVLEYLEG